MKNIVIGVDIGGTKMAIGKITEEGKVLEKVVFPTEREKGHEYITTKTIKMIEKLIKGKIKKILGIGVGCGGPLDAEKGIILSPPNLPGWDRVPIKSIFENKFGLKTIVDNDANAAGLGEWTFGAGKNSNILVYMTVSTGIGGGLIIGGKIYHGTNFNGAEIGHMTIDIDGPLCGCGNYGCFEAMASGTAIGRMGKEAVKKNQKTLMISLADGNINNITAKIVATAARMGDITAKMLIEKEAVFLGIGISNVVSVINPDTVIIGGGVSNSLDMMIDKIYETVRKKVMLPLFEVVTIKKALLGEDVGIIGAASLILKSNSLR